MTISTATKPAPTWDLDSIFPGGSKSKEFRHYRDKVRANIESVKQQLAKLPVTLDNASVTAWTDFILAFQDLAAEIQLIVSLANCLASADAADSDAAAIQAEGDLFWSQWEKIKSGLEALSLKQSDDAWEKLVTGTKLNPIRFFLDEMRRLARSKMPLEQEALLLDLAVDGYHAWNRLYDKMAADIRVDFVENGATDSLSLGQLATKMSSPDRSLRAQAFEKMESAWEKMADLAAMALNSQAGFRLTMYERRGWDSPLFEPLFMAKMSQASLDAMWSVISRESARLKPYIEAKKKLLGIDKFCWYDEFAPCGKTDRIFGYDEAADFIIANVGKFSTELSEFCRMAVDKRWVEAELRPGKRAGAYCSDMGPIRESRVFMTFSGTYDSLLTLAHELGHAYHQHVLKETPYFATWYPMTLAETASIFNELLVTDAALAAADDKQEQLMLIEQKLQQAYVFFCDLHCRYLFERMFYSERANGVVGRDRLCEMMVAAQKQAYGDLLDESGYHPLFWASKLHFYITDTPFYNYPYTFGFLFAGGVYDRASKEGSAFAPKYQALLRDSGSMSSEEAAAKHLGVDLTTESFWTDAVNRSLADVGHFSELADKA